MEASDRIIEFINMSDDEFYEAYLKNASIEELWNFFSEFPDFKLKGFEFTEEDSEKLYNKIMANVKELET